MDALGVLSWADQGASTLATTDFLQAGSVCVNGGETSDGVPGYAPFGQTAADFDAAMFFDADPAVVAATNQLRSLDPCGDDNSIVAAISAAHPRSPPSSRAGWRHAGSEPRRPPLRPSGPCLTRSDRCSILLPIRAL